MRLDVGSFRIQVPKNLIFRFNFIFKLQKVELVSLVLRKIASALRLFINRFICFIFRHSPMCGTCLMPKLLLLPDTEMVSAHLRALLNRSWLTYQTAHFGTLTGRVVSFMTVSMNRGTHNCHLLLPGEQTDRETDIQRNTGLQTDTVRHRWSLDE